MKMDHIVEKAIKNAEDYPKKKELWKSVSKQMTYQTFNLIIKELEESGKILFCKDGAIIWTHNPKLLKMAVKVR